MGKITREQYMAAFLRGLAKLYLKNPDLKVDEDIIYRGLMNFGFTSLELKDRDIKDNFEKWIKHFIDNENIDVYYFEPQPGFLQFSSNDNNYRCIKLYLSFSKDKIYECVNKIFEFIASNKMTTRSKVSDIIRSDSVVIRLDDIKSAKMLINYINTDPELISNSRLVNPFLIKSGVVGIAYDHMLSYNSVLAFLLANYLRHCKTNNKLDTVSVTSFKQYVDIFRSVLFENSKNLKMFTMIPNVSKYLYKYNDDEISLICNYDEIMELISMSLNDSMDLEGYFNFYNQCLDEKIQMQKYQYYQNIVGEKKKIPVAS